MSVEALKGYKSALVAKVHDLLNGLAARQGQDIDISAWMTYFG